MDKLNRAAVAYIVAALFIASISALTPVAIVVAQNNTTGTNTTTAGAQNNTTGTNTTTAGAQNNTTGTNTTTVGAGVGNTTQAQGSTPQFSANLTGELTFPPTVTNATGTGEFTVVGDGNTMRYTIDANNIDKVTDVFVAASSGGRYADLVQLRSGVNDGISGPINGTLVEGNFTSSDFTGRLNIEQMSDLLKLILDGNAYVRIQTFDAPLGKIVGKITPNLPQ
jgi:CHRD domain